MFVVVYWSTNLYTKVPLSIAEKLNINLRLFMERRVVNITQRSKGSEASHTVTRGLPVSLEQFQSAASFARVQSESLKSACGALSALGSWRAGRGRPGGNGGPVVERSEWHCRRLRGCISTKVKADLVCDRRWWMPFAHTRSPRCSALSYHLAL